MADARVTRDYDQEEAGFESSGDRVRIKNQILDITIYSGSIPFWKLGTHLLH